MENICFGEDSYYWDKNSNQTYYWDINNNPTKVSYHIFVSDEIECENIDLIKEARLSFVSGHTSISFYSATFLASFMHKNLNHKASLPLQLGIFILAFWISITRITDYKHHFEDIFFF